MLSTLKKCSEEMEKRIERVTDEIMDVLILHSENEIRIRNTMESNKRKREKKEGKERGKRKRNW
jgi:hypothetical protein